MMFRYQVSNPRLPGCPNVCAPPTRDSAIGWCGPGFRVRPIKCATLWRTAAGLARMESRAKSAIQYGLFTPGEGEYLS